MIILVVLRCLHREPSVDAIRPTSYECDALTGRRCLAKKTDAGVNKRRACWCGSRFKDAVMSSSSNKFFFFHSLVLGDAADAPNRRSDRWRRVRRSVVLGYVRRKYCQQWLRWWGKPNAALEARASAFRTCALSWTQGVYLVPSRVILSC